MATVTLRAVWLNDAADPSSYVALRYAGSLSLAPAVEGSVRQLASSRLRAVSRKGKATQWQVASPHIDRAQEDWIVAHVGRPVWVRDWTGRKVYGIYWTSPLEQHTYNLNSDVSFTIDELTPAVV